MSSERDKPSIRARLTGMAQPVTNSVARAHEYFKSHPEPTAWPAKVLRKSVRTKGPGINAQELPMQPERSDEEQERK